LVAPASRSCAGSKAPISRDVTRTGRRIIFILRGGPEQGHEAFMGYPDVRIMPMFV
jgi:hypothetical protein